MLVGPLDYKVFYIHHLYLFSHAPPTVFVSSVAADHLRRLGVDQYDCAAMKVITLHSSGVRFNALILKYFFTFQYLAETSRLRELENVLTIRMCRPKSENFTFGQRNLPSEYPREA